MTGRVDINIRYNGNDIGDISPMDDSRIRSIYQGRLKQKFDAAAGILNQFNVQQHDIIDYAKTLRARMAEADIPSLNANLAPYDLEAEIDVPFDMDLMIE